MQETVFFYTLGCRLNHTETALMAQSLEQEGFQVYDSPKDEQNPNFCVINSCTVTATADHKCYKLISQLHAKHKQTKIIVVGCLSQVAKAELFQKNQVALVLGNNEKSKLAFYIRQWQKQEGQEQADNRVFVSTIDNQVFKQTLHNQKRLRTRVNIKIQDGCNFYCSYCIIPFARGPARSRDSQDILLEAQTLAESNVKEIILTGINLGCYSPNGETLLSLLKKINEIPNLKRIRISSIEPMTLTPGLLEYMGDVTTKLTPSLHLPLQAAHNYTLKRMKRKYSLEQYADVLLQAYRLVPDICLSTDIITGFPGETKAIFEESKEWLNSMPLHFYHVFPYAERKGVKSADLDQQQTRAVAKERAKELIKLSRVKHTEYKQQFLQKKLPVLWEYSTNEEWYGYTNNYIRVKTTSKKDIGNQLKKSLLLSMEEPYVIADSKE